MQRRLFAIILLFGVLALNMGSACQALCIGGHGTGHAQTEVRAASNAHNGHDGHCPLPAPGKHAQAGKNCHHQEGSVISCDCSHELSAALDHDIRADFLSAITPPALSVIIQPAEKSSVSAKESIPQEQPPRRLA